EVRHDAQDTEHTDDDGRNRAPADVAPPCGQRMNLIAPATRRRGTQGIHVPSKRANGVKGKVGKPRTSARSGLCGTEPSGDRPDRAPRAGRRTPGAPPRRPSPG